MDIVGPLERTQRGHKYILVVCDYTTRYPEVFPLCKVTATTIPQALFQLFSRVGIPQEIITDQGAAFLSKKLKQVYCLLGIKGIRTTPYHPQTDGLVERYNQTLKGMIWKYVAINGKDWDYWLPYLMFAYREVQQASTGFSPAFLNCYTVWEASERAPGFAQRGLGGSKGCRVPQCSLPCS